MMKCIICDEHTTVSTWADCGDHKAIRCAQCDFIWIDPMPTDKELDEFYANFNDLRDALGHEYNKKREIQYLIDRDFINNFFIDQKNVITLDFGCYDGSFIDTFDDRYTKYGVEKNTTAAEWAQNNRIFGTNVYSCDVVDIPHEDEYFDLIMMRGVIEHLNDPNRVMRKLYRLLKSGGILYICATPNVGSYSAKKFRNKWNQFTIPEHVLYFSDITLEKYLDKYGFDMIAKHFPYSETPYANLKKDFNSIKQDYNDKVNTPFYNNMVNAVFYKRGQ